MIYTCPSCNSKFQSDVSGAVECPSCKQRVMVEGAPSAGCAWDTEGGKNWFNAFFQTSYKVMTDPEKFFQAVEAGQGFKRPYIFALIISYVFFGIMIAYQLGFQMLAVGMEAAQSVQKDLFPVVAFGVPFAIIFVLIFFVIGVPIFTLMMTFLRAGIYHLCLMILGGATREFQATFRVVCYASSPQLLQVVPILGNVVAWAWQLVLDIIGLKIVHRISYGKSILAVFLPTMLCCGLVALVIAMIAGGVIAAVISGST